jgi:hypothetical protein
MVFRTHRLDTDSKPCRHVAPDTLVTHRYHGTGKALCITRLLQCDIVLTTYASVAADFCRGRSTLHQIEWYRVVLDEGRILNAMVFPCADLFSSLDS